MKLNKLVARCLHSASEGRANRHLRLSPTLSALALALLGSQGAQAVDCVSGVAYAYTGQSVDCTVPQGVTSMAVTVIGGGGGGNGKTDNFAWASHAAAGTGYITVSPNDALLLSTGAGGHSNGGGGSSSIINRTTSTILVVSGGGGGGWAGGSAGAGAGAGGGSSGPLGGIGGYNDGTGGLGGMGTGGSGGNGGTGGRSLAAAQGGNATGIATGGGGGGGVSIQGPGNGGTGFNGISISSVGAFGGGGAASSNFGPGGGGGGGGYGGGGGAGSEGSPSAFSTTGGGSGSSYGPGIAFVTVSSGPGAGGGWSTAGQNGSIWLNFTSWAFSSLNSGSVGFAYAQTITATGGTGNIAYAITSGSLPTGLTLSSAGELSGTPTAGGSFNFTVTATDSAASPGPFKGSYQYALVVDPATIAAPSPAALPAGTEGASYSQTLTTLGGTAPYSFAVTNGALPNGITLSPAGVLSGTPTAYGTFPIEVTVTDASTGTGPYSSPPTAYSLVIAPSVHSVGGNVSGLAAGKSVVLQNNGGDNLSVSASGSFAFSAPVANGSGYAVTVLTQPADQTCTVTQGSGTMGASNVSDVAVSCVSGLSISTAGFGNLQVGHDLSGVQLSAAGGSGSYTWSAADATQPLPAGLSLSASGLLTGTPTTAGAYTSSVTVTDSGGTSQQMLMTTKAANAVSQVFSGTVAAAVATPTATPVPSLGAWAVVLLNLMAAALGALGLRWRRRSAGLTDSTPKHH